MKGKLLALLLCAATLANVTTVGAATLPHTTETKVIRVTSKASERKLYDTLRKRNGAIVVEISNGTALGNGKGKDDLGYYRAYGKQFHKGDRVQSVFVYNPGTNYEDDILTRTDTLLYARYKEKCIYRGHNIFEDSKGECWEYRDSSRKFKKGKTYTITFNDMATEDIFDDYIISVK